MSTGPSVRTSFRSATPPVSLSRHATRSCPLRGPHRPRTTPTTPYSLAGFHPITSGTSAISGSTAERHFRVPPPSDTLEITTCRAS
jgi:hypothetical protein